MQNMSSTTVGIIVAVVIAALALIWFLTQRRRHQVLRERFGPEYDRTVQTVGTAGKADALLEERARRVETYHIKPLSPDQARGFGDRWQRVQAMFVDDPSAAVTDADALVNEVMAARGYPTTADFDRKAEDLTVEHAKVVQHYRAAREIAARHARREATTEDLRQALVHYRDLFADLLGPRDTARRTA